MKLPA